MNIYAHYKRNKAGWGIGFGPRPTHCAECLRELPAPEGCSTGYGSEGREPIASHPDAPALKPGESLERSKAVCYPCCGERDKRDMESSGRAVLYLSDVSGGAIESRSTARDRMHVTNWPGTLSIPVSAYRRSRNNFGAQRIDVWFAFGGFEWHGINLGARNEILRCKRTKRRA